MKKAGVLLMFLTAAFAHEMFAQQAGDLDSTFGVGGIVTTDFDTSAARARSIAIQPDGKIIAVGKAYIPHSTSYFALARYNSDGTLDTSFGSSGKVITNLTSDHEVSAVAVQADGKIVVVGGIGIGAGIPSIALVRYNTDGVLDNTFGTLGIVLAPVTFDYRPPLVIQSDGKILMAQDDNIFRYHTDGTLDNSFDTSGISNGSILSIAIQSDGRIVAAGYKSNYPFYSDFALARYNMEGTLDNSFGIGGTVITDFDTSGDRVNSVALQPDGKIVVAGWSGGDTIRFALARYNTDGTLDNSFGTDGRIVVGNESDFQEAESVAVQADGKIVVTGTLRTGFGLLRLNSDGSLDNSFGTAGKVVTDFGFSYSITNALAIQPDGKIVAVGYLYKGPDDYVFALARYLSGLNVGILSFSPAENVLIYPNPIHSNETFEYSLQQDEVLSISLYDMGGRLAQQFISNESRSKGNHKESLQFKEDLPAGNYLLTITNAQGSMSVKVAKQ